VTGLMPNLKFKHCYQVDVSDDFLQFLQDGCIFIELNRVLGGTQYELIGRGKIPLRKFLNSQHFNGFVKIQSTDSIVNEIASIQFSIAAKIPFENAATLHLEKSTARGFLQEDEGNHRFNSLSVNIIAGRQLDGIFDNEEPSCFCVYKFFTYDEMHTSVIESSSNPRFNFSARHSVEENENLHRYLSTGKLTIVVVDKSDDGDDQEEFLGKCEIVLTPLIQRDEITEVCTLVDPHGDESGQLEVRLAWEHPYKENHGATKEAIIIPAEVEYENPILSESQKSSPRHGRSQSSASLISASLKSRTPSREVTPAAENNSQSEKEKTPTPAPRLSTQSSSDPYPFQAKNIDDEGYPTPSLSAVDKIKSPSPTFEDAPSLEATPTPESEDAQEPENGSKELRIRIKELRRGQDADEAVLESKVFIEYSLCGKLCETNPSMEYPKTFENPTIINHDEIMTIDEGSEEENQLKLMMNGEFDSRVTFTLLTDPGEDDEGSVDCEDVATAQINLRDFKESPDLQDHLLEFVSTSSEVKILGQLLIDVSVAQVIRALH